MREYQITLLCSDGSSVRYLRFAYSPEAAAKSCELEFLKDYIPTEEIVSVSVSWPL